jgi:hypothetical protein
VAHPVYGLDTLFKKYPKVEKAFEATMPEFQGSLFFILGETGCIKAPKTLLETIDQTIDDPAEEKEALMIAALYVFAPEAYAREAAQFEDNYSLRAKDILDSVRQYNENFMETGKREIASTDQARVLAAISIALTDGVHEMISEVIKGLQDDMEDDMSARELIQAEMGPLLKNSRAQMEEDRKALSKNMHAPKLEVAMLLALDKAEKALAEIDAAVQTPPAPKKPGGNGPGL